MSKKIKEEKEIKEENTLKSAGVIAGVEHFHVLVNKGKKNERTAIMTLEMYEILKSKGSI